MKAVNVILIAIFLATMAGCSDKNDSTGPSYGFNEDLVANWFLLSYEDEDGLQDYTGFINFSEQKTFTGQFVDEEGDANYSGTIETTSTTMKLNITNSDALWIEEGIYQFSYVLTSTSLTIEGVVDDENVKFVYTKEAQGDGEGIFAGIVKRASNGNPLENALIEIQNTQFNVYTDFSGNFSIEDIPVGTYTATISITGFITINETIEIINNETTYAVFEMEEETGGNGMIYGGVIDFVSQAFVEGALIEVLGTNLSTTTSVEGIYSITNVPTGEYSVKCSKVGYDDQTNTNIVVISNEETSSDYILFPEGTTNYGAISGTVTNSSNGEPIPNVVVQVVGLYNSMATAADGTYILAMVPEGTYDVSFTKPSYQTQTISNVEVVSNEEITLDAALTQEDGVGNLGATVTNQLGLPISGVLIEVIGTEFEGITGVAGLCQINDIPAGMYNIRASKSGYTTQDIENVEILSGIPKLIFITLH
ncbi:MAG: carboxypeptidase regulatory-like domain-containing protein [Candidatus Cloacimonetes bacterium]|nr:carboxypeptidase regulatory-like domain-containing protein [Candidatus Cloacimonadota bacterium]